MWCRRGVRPCPRRGRRGKITVCSAGSSAAVGKSSSSGWGGPPPSHCLNSWASTNRLPVCSARRRACSAGPLNISTGRLPSISGARLRSQLSLFFPPGGMSQWPWSADPTSTVSGGKRRRRCSHKRVLSVIRSESTFSDRHQYRQHLRTNTWEFVVPELVFEPQQPKRPQQ